MADEASGTTKVEIFGVAYPLRGGGDPERLRQFGREVDERMREVAAHAPSADRTRLAILAALNLAEELHLSRELLERDRRECAERIAQLTGRLAASLS